MRKNMHMKNSIQDIQDVLIWNWRYLESGKQSTRLINIFYN